MKKIGLYIHIPFCIKKCNYCDFNSYSGKENLHEEYVKCLVYEMKNYNSMYEGIVVDTIFIGGGTPTCLGNKQIEYLLSSCYEIFDIARGAEITIECNPGTLGRDKLKAMKASGINRLSIGLQSFQDKELKSLGRIHTKDEFIENYYAARSEGFNNINIDLMFSIPEQDLKSWESNIQNVIRLNPEHISCYSLIVEEGTGFYESFLKNEITLPTEEVDRLMYDKAINLLKDTGYVHYEISNFSKDSYQCKHNIKYWKMDEYLGIGAGAHSFIDNVRYSNVNCPEEYIKAISFGTMPVKDKTSLSKQDLMSEFIFLGLRLLEGINTCEFKMKFHEDICSIYKEQIDKFISLNLLRRIGDNLTLTYRGIDISNKIFLEFI